MLQLRNVNPKIENIFSARSCVGLIGLPVDPDTLHAVLRLTLRLTREHEVATKVSIPKILVKQGR